MLGDNSEGIRELTKEEIAAVAGGLMSRPTGGGSFLIRLIDDFLGFFFSDNRAVRARQQ